MTTSTDEPACWPALNTAGPGELVHPWFGVQKGSGWPRHTSSFRPREGGNCLHFL
ncbi:DNA circularization N-terminal domain-containing protein [Klebsiella pneumoniae]|uniref:DNA circularization N-terminal domain-containing protein n=1 Tax=Klebsiella pneumoniae TaxID=573 RepID=UPI003326AB0F